MVADSMSPSSKAAEAALVGAPQYHRHEPLLGLADGGVDLLLVVLRRPDVRLE
jgi:hypothetical protein